MSKKLPKDLQQAIDDYDKFSSFDSHRILLDNSLHGSLANIIIYLQDLLNQYPNAVIQQDPYGYDGAFEIYLVYTTPKDKDIADKERQAIIDRYKKIRDKKMAAELELLEKLKKKYENN
jgi:hypothetical protein